MKKRRTYGFKDEVDRLYEIANELDSISEKFDRFDAEYDFATMNGTLARLEKLVEESNEHDLRRELRLLQFRLHNELSDDALIERYEACYSSTRKMANWVRRQKDYLRGRTTYGNYNVYENGAIYYRNSLLNLPAQQQRLLASFLQAENHTLDAEKIRKELKIEEYNVSEAVRKLKGLLRKQCNLSSAEAITGKSKVPRIYTLDVNL